MYMILSASPNADGLTAACIRAATAGFEKANATVQHIDLCKAAIEACRVCGDGWGICRSEHRCVIGDQLAQLQENLKTAEGVFLITPVYWGQPSERMKYFLDRYRRCEALKGDASGLNGTRVNLIAAAGGSGNGTVTCLSEMEAWTWHVRAIPSERIGITRFNRTRMLHVIEDAAVDMALSDR